MLVSSLFKFFLYSHVRGITEKVAWKQQIAIEKQISEYYFKFGGKTAFYATKWRPKLTIKFNFTE